jgi:hypothetical protein
MNLPDEKVSEAIAVLMGVCWHEWAIPPELLPQEKMVVTCKYCGSIFHKFDTGYLMPPNKTQFSCLH